MGSNNLLARAYLLSAVAVVVAVLGSLVIMETATVKLSVPTSTVTANLIISGGQSGQNLTTTRIHADVTDTLQGTASTVVVPAAYANGQAVFACSPCSAISIPAGAVVSTNTTPSVHYATLETVQLSASNTSATVAIRALVAGPSGNALPNTVTVIDKPIPNVKVQNPKAIAGGADETTGQVIQQSDLDFVQQELSAKVAQDLDATLKAQAEGLRYVADGPPALKVTSDHKAGDQASTFTMTMTATLGAIAFSESAADSLMRNALDQKVPKGFQLTASPIQTSYQVQKSSANGDVTIKGSAVGVVVPNVTADELKARIKGLRVDTARRQLEKLAPGTTVNISVKPAVPWMPVLQDHISLTIVLESGTVSPAV